MSPFHPIIPTDPEEQMGFARKLARRMRAPRAIELAVGSRAERLHYAYPMGLAAGAEFMLRCARAHEMRVPTRFAHLDRSAAMVWANALAGAATLPPAAAFPSSGEKFSIAAYHAGYERGVILALEQLGLRRQG